MLARLGTTTGIKHAQNVHKIWKLHLDRKLSQDRKNTGKKNNRYKFPEKLLPRCEA